MPGPKVAIIGAGPGGLTLARLLQQHSIPVTIYEAEESRFVRNQGGTLDLHPKSGQLALKEAGLIEEFKKHSRPEAEALKLIKYDGSVFWDENEMGNVRPVDLSDRPEIDRVKLRDILLDSLEEGTIKWGKKVARVEADAKRRGKHILFFTDYTTEGDIDLLVGADGAWSKVRPLLTSEKPYYSGISSIELWCNDVEKKDPWLSKFIGAGSCFMFDEGRALQCQRNGNGSIRVYASLRVPETWVDDCGIDFTNHETARQQIVEKYWNDCNDDLKRVILSAKDELIPRKLYMLPVGLKWDPVPGVTLLGDAAHLMTPFAGVGVNVAMADALELAKACISKVDSFKAKFKSDGRNIEEATREYETGMFERGKQNAEKTAKNMRLHFSSQGGEEMAGRLNKGLEQLKAKQAEKKAAGGT